MLFIIVLGAPHFDARLAFSFPPGAFNFNMGFVLGLCSDMLIAMFDYLGYYNVCYIDDEVIHPVRASPRSIIYCVLACASGFLAIEFVSMGAVRWLDA